MLQDLVVERQSNIDRQAERDKAAINYISSIIEQNWGELNRVLNPQGKISVDELPEILFDATQRIIREIEQEYCRSIGIHVYYLPENYKSTNPAVQLGWAEFTKIFSSEDAPKLQEIPHSLRPTQLGIDIVNGYRSAQCYVSLEEQRRINSEQTA